MRDRETIDSELKAMAAVRRSVREQGGQLSSRHIDALLDERLGHRKEAHGADAAAARQSDLVTKPGPRRDRTHDMTVHRRQALLRRLRLLAALPLSLVGVAGLFVVMLAVHDPHPAAQPTVIPPTDARPEPASPQLQVPADPNAQSSGIVDRAFIDVLKQYGVPIPSNEYAMTHGHAVCDFLTHDADFAEAVHSVQQSSIWDADQSADFAAGAIASYCPQSITASPDQAQQTVQDALSRLQAIDRDLEGIRDDLQDISGQP